MYLRTGSVIDGSFRGCSFGCRRVRQGGERIESGQSRERLSLLSNVPRAAATHGAWGSHYRRRAPAYARDPSKFNGSLRFCNSR